MGNRGKKKLWTGRDENVSRSTTTVIVEAVLSYNDGKNLTAPGTFVELGGKNMHIYSIGEGEKTFVLIPGLGTTSPYVDF